MCVCAFSQMFIENNQSSLCSLCFQQYITQIYRENLSQTKSSGNVSLHKSEQKESPLVSSPNHPGIILVLWAE